MKSITWSTDQSIESTNKNYYRVVQLLGEGKSASAYLALKTGSNDRGTFHVVKLMQHPSDQSKLASFNSEKNLITRFNHESIIRIHDEGFFNANNESYPYYICDFYSNTLESLIKNSSLRLTRKLSYAIQLCSALEHLSNHSIVHCDVKPGNIYGDGLKCVLADFGLSLDTNTPISKGSLPSLHRYRSPDIVDAQRNGTALTPKSDVFQLGLVLTELFTGQNPCVQAKDGSEKVHINYLPDVYGRHGREIKSILSEMLIEDPVQRPTAGALIDKWQGILFKAYIYLVKIEKNIY